MKASQKKQLIYLAATIAGAIAGVVFVRYLMLDRIELMAWNMFWRNFPDINWDLLGDAISRSNTFKKTMGGAIVGAIAGPTAVRVWRK